jgi:hypothetical protein
MSQDPRWTADTEEWVTRIVHQEQAPCKPCHHLGDGDEVDVTTARAILTALADAGLLRGPSGPQGDEQAAPRVWAMPEEPGPDVTRVRDVYGQCFERADAIDEHGSIPVWVGDTFTTEADVPDLYLSWKQLMAGHAPLTEVDGSLT